MQLEIDKIYHGFKLIEEKVLKEIGSTSRLFYHENSGARLFQLENDDDNKVFSISFKTPPGNSTGLPHILEHSVLCGSRKFPMKEPFVELVKGSLNTFLNAMTFSDKTMYPIASKNDKDFFNLMDVYMDAVFYPNIYKYPEIFMQEGWHYELDNKDRDITYKGVVYNEMKGAFSAPESILMRKIQESLFPDTLYGFESGGDPDVIPELIVEEFLSFHKKYYHPSNSYIYLYGNGDILEQMKFIDTQYLKDFKKINIDSHICSQKPFMETRKSVIEYPISPNEEGNDKTFFSLNFATGKATDPEVYLAMQILEYMLLETPAAPLKKALIDAQIGKDVFGQFDNGILQPTFSVVVKNSNEGNKEKFVKVIFETLKELVKDGIDKKLIEASINIREFALREADEHGLPKGLVYNIKCLESWLYEGNPTLHIEYENTLNKIKTALTSDYFEKMISKYLVDNKHCSLIELKPVKGLAEAKAEDIKKVLVDYKLSLTDKEINELIQRTLKLRERQSTPDSPENLATIPLLSLEDIKPQADMLPLLEKDEKGIKVLSHPMFTNKIVYMNFMFNTNAISQKLLPYISLLTDILGKSSTEKYSYGDLSNEINIHTGGIEFGIDAYDEYGKDNEFFPLFIVRSKSLSDKLPKLTELALEIIRHTKFGDKKRMKEIIQEIKSQLEMRMLDRGHLVASRRLSSYYSLSGQYIEILAGLTYYKFIVGIEKNFDSMIDSIALKLEEITTQIFNKKNLIISITCEESDYSKFKENFEVIHKGLGDAELVRSKYNFNLDPQNEGLMTPSKVQYVAKGYNYKKLGYSYTGSLQVLKVIGSYDYLWNRIRVQGGAYGAFIKFDRNGNSYFVSYRDPNLCETLAVYDEMYSYIKNFDADEREMTKYIIGTISKMDLPLTPSMKGELSTEYYIKKISFQDIQRERQQVLGTKKEDIQKFADLVLGIMKQNYICVLGSESKIKENKEIFKSLINVFE